MPEDVLSLSREIFVPREIIFELWTEPAHLAYWYPPTPASSKRFVLDLLVGGEYEFSWTDESGAPHRETGEFIDLERPERLVYSARHARQEGDATDTADYEVEVGLRDHSGTTRIEVRQTGFTSDDDRKRCTQEWMHRLEGLESYLSSI